MPAAKLRRWSAAGRELRRRDPGRYRALLELTEGILRVHRRQSRQSRDLSAEIRRLLLDRR